MGSNKLRSLASNCVVILFGKNWLILSFSWPNIAEPSCFDGQYKNSVKSSLFRSEAIEEVASEAARKPGTFCVVLCETAVVAGCASMLLAQ